MNPQLEIKIKQLPDSPGCYLMKSHGEIIYVGKAKNLKNRVRQYFQSSRNHTPKVQAMVSRVEDFDIVLVDSELEALILSARGAGSAHGARRREVLRPVHGRDGGARHT